MKLKKLLALGASLMLVSSCAVLPVSAESDSDMVVVGVSKDNSSYTLRRYGDYAVDRETIEKYNPSIGELHLGDIVTVEGIDWSFLEKEDELDDEYESSGTPLLFVPWNNLLDFVDENALSFSVAGSVFDNPETRNYEVISSRLTGWGSELTGYVEHDVLCVLDDGINDIRGMKGLCFQFRGDIGNYTFTPPNYIDWTDLQKGDTVSCIIYDNVPIFVAEKVSDITVKPVSAVTANGDADGNGALDILDIITVNKAVLGKENLDAERIPYIDFNQNQVPDSDDALTMLKMIAGLA